MRLNRLLLFLGLTIGATLLAWEPALAQCAMCRTALEQNGELAGGFNRGILFLLGMPYLVFAAVGGAWYWKRRQARLSSASRSRGRDGSWGRISSPSPRLES